MQAHQWLRAIAKAADEVLGDLLQQAPPPLANRAGRRQSSAGISPVVPGRLYVAEIENKRYLSYDLLPHSPRSFLLTYLLQPRH